MRQVIRNSKIIPALVVLVLFLFPNNFSEGVEEGPAMKFWNVQSIDTMKYSRDRARQELNNPQFDQVINQQMGEIASTGANYVAISTPYDAEFLPILKRWVKSAREHNLSVWFRGNFSGWEKWFDYPKISAVQHLEKLTLFIQSNPELFSDDDIFTSCPECENGGPGDPRRTGSVVAFRNFLIDEHTAAQNAFSKINKKITTNYFSMNGDVAKLIMDKDTTAKLGGVVSIDHYVPTPDKMISDIDALANSSGGKIILGEFGAPIPDIQGKFTDEQQKNWMQETLDKLVRNPNVIGMNYWVGVGGSTAIWNDDNTPHSAVSVLNSYFTPDVISGTVLNILLQPIRDAKISSDYRQVSTDVHGQFFFPKISGASISAQVSADNYRNQTVVLEDAHSELVLQKTHESLWFKFLKLLKAF